mmetsp:Transcript_49672/g.107609  ORF Transcript_49672/g.107609 Transcript_49672/m.107609 type:complete len:200 (+) Transcript_49672:394-993(+)
MSRQLSNGNACRLQHTPAFHIPASATRKKLSFDGWRADPQQWILLVVTMVLQGWTGQKSQRLRSRPRPTTDAAAVGSSVTGRQTAQMLKTSRRSLRVLAARDLARFLLPRRNATWDASSIAALSVIATEAAPSFSGATRILLPPSTRPVQRSRARARWAVGLAARRTCPPRWCRATRASSADRLATGHAIALAPQRAPL